MKYNVVFYNNKKIFAIDNLIAEKPIQALNKMLIKNKGMNYFQSIIVNENGSVFIYSIKKENKKYIVMPEIKDLNALQKNMVWNIFAGNNTSLDYLKMR